MRFQSQLHVLQSECRLRSTDFETLKRGIESMNLLHPRYFQNIGSLIEGKRSTHEAQRKYFSSRSVKFEISLTLKASFHVKSEVLTTFVIIRKHRKQLKWKFCFKSFSRRWKSSLFLMQRMAVAKQHEMRFHFLIRNLLLMYCVHLWNVFHQHRFWFHFLVNIKNLEHALPLTLN